MAHRKLKSDCNNRPGGALQLRLRQYSERLLGPPLKGRTSLQGTMESTTGRSLKRRGEKMDWYKIRLIVISTHWNQWKQKATKTMFGLASMKGYIAMLHSSLLFLIQQRMSSNRSHWLQAISENNSLFITKKIPKCHTNAYGTSSTRKSKHLCQPNLSGSNVSYQNNVWLPPP